MKDDPNIVCGYWFLNTGTKEALIDACSWHDSAYLKESPQQYLFTRLEVDRWFLSQMLLLAGDNRLRQVKAHVFYGITRALGWMFWEKKPKGDKIEKGGMY